MVLNPDALNKGGIDLMGLMLNPNEAMYTHALNALENDYKYHLFGLVRKIWRGDLCVRKWWHMSALN